MKRNNFLKRIAAGMLAVFLVMEGGSSMIVAAEDGAEEPAAREAETADAADPALVGSIDASLVGELKSTGTVTVSNDGYCEYAEGQQSVYNGVNVGAGTRYYKADGSTAYCVEPEYPGTPNPVTLEAYEIEDSSFSGHGEEIRKVMYRTYGAPGYKEDEAFYAKMQEVLAYETANTPYKDINQVGYTYGHIMMSKIFTDVKGRLNYGGDISNWIVGLHGAYEHMIQYTNELVYFALKAAAAPANFHVYLVPSTAAKNQSYMYWTYEPIGYLYVHKFIDPPERAEEIIGKGYDMGGAKYQAYTDEACTNAVGDVMTVAAGGTDTNTISLPLGTYWVRETEGPSQGWYTLNQDPVRVVLTGQHTSEAYKVYSGERPYFAKVKLHKASSRPIPDTIKNREKYHRKGAVYEIYYDPDGDGVSTEKVFEAETKTVSGDTAVFSLPIGHYFAREVQGPTNGGYALNEEPVPFDITAANCADNPAVAEDYIHVIETADTPIFGGLRIKKVPAEETRELTDHNPCCQLAGAEFSVYSDGSLSEDSLIGTLTTDQNGETEVLGDLGEGTCYIVETKPSPGFEIAADFTRENPREVTISAENLDDVLVVTCEEPAAAGRISLEIVKEDAEGEPIAALAGARFEVHFYKGYYDEASLPENPDRVWTIETKTDEKNGRCAAFLDDEYLVRGAKNDPLYRNEDGKVILPLGTVAITETKAPFGYIFEDGKILSVIRIDEAFLKNEGQGRNVVASAKVTVKEERARFRFTFTKTDREGRPLADVPFLVRNTATGEQHILVTDQNGVLSTEKNPHSLHTNANDAAYKSGKLDEAGLDPDAGVWFYGTSGPGAGTVRDDRGALYGGEYTVTELRSSANAGLALIDPLSIIVGAGMADGGTIDLGNLIDEKKTIETNVASVGIGSQTAFAEEAAAFEDKVTLCGFKGACEIKTSIYDPESGERLSFSDGSEEITTKVNANGSNTEIVIPFTINASKLAGHEAAVVTAVVNEGETITHNSDFTAEEEKIYFPKIVTTFTDSDTGMHISLADSEVTNYDRIFCRNLAAGENYSIITIIMDADGAAYRKDGSVMEDASGTPMNYYRMADVDGSPGEKLENVRGALLRDNILFSVTEFTAEAESAETFAAVSYDGMRFAGRKVIAAEGIFSEGKLIAAHIAPEDEAQSIYFPKIVTAAANAADGSRVITESPNAGITDTLRYEMYPAGTCVRTVLELLNADTGEILMRDGKPLTTEKMFNPEGSGEETVAFSFDSTGFGSIRIGLRETNYVLAGDTWVPCASDSFLENEMQILTHVPKPEKPGPTPSTATPPPAAPTPVLTSRSVNPVKTGDASNAFVWSLLLLLGMAAFTAAIKIYKK